MKIVESFVETGEPIGSRSLSQQLSTSLSPATIRNVMADLEDFGLLFAPHTSAGRMPTDTGLRMFVDGLLEIGNLTSDELDDLESRLAGTGKASKVFWKKLARRCPVFQTVPVWSWHRTQILRLSILSSLISDRAALWWSW